jgi:hypothetical protein
MIDYTNTQPAARPRGRVISTIIIASAVFCLAAVVLLIAIPPRTDDATVLANFIGIAPVVEGPVVRLACGTTNSFIREICCMRSMTCLIVMHSSRHSRNRARSKEASVTSRG